MRKHPFLEALTVHLHNGEKMLLLLAVLSFEEGWIISVLDPKHICQGIRLKITIHERMSISAHCHLDLWVLIHSLLLSNKRIICIEEERSKCEVERSGTFLQMGQICGCLLVQVGTWSDFHRALGHGGTVPFHADLRLRWLTEAFDRALIMENIQVAGWGVAGMTSPAINGPRGLGAGVYLCQPSTRMFFHMFFQMLSVAPYLPMQSEGEGQAVPSMKKGSTIWDWIFLFLGKWALRARIQYMHTITEMWCFLESKQWKLTLAHSRCITLKSFLFS